jgi:ADP-ribosylglycohydrolase/protein tyrosine phosphatase (PTP) superfamily phosphohydrolase (DUF442 family)
MPDVPFPKAWWVQAGRLLAGCYPGDKDPVVAKSKLTALLDAGVRAVVCLQEKDERGHGGEPFVPYEGMLRELARERGVDVPWRRVPIPDFGVPQAETMEAIFDMIDDFLARDMPVYVHCWGGHGRTATVVGCWLVSHGMRGEEALRHIAELRSSRPELRREPAPQSGAQHEMIASWPRCGSRHVPQSPEGNPCPPGGTVAVGDRYRGGLVGLAVGDALGTTLEFRRPGTFAPIDDIAGGGPFRLQPGQWTDDTSMALCLAESLVEKRGFDPVDQLERYCRWWREGYLSSTGQCFDIGATTAGALSRFQQTGNPWSGPTEPDTAGNGSLMRLVPVPLAFASDPEKAIAMAGESSRTTHGARECIDACSYFAGLVVGALRGTPKEELLCDRYAPIPGHWLRHTLCPAIEAIAAGSFKEKQPPSIRGSGYVVHSLEAALWAFHNSRTFRDGALLAVNLGDDADTTGAVYGQLAGVFYGATKIPGDWCERVAKRDLLVGLAERLLALAASMEN